MNAMNIPGFTAESSLSKSNEHYQLERDFTWQHRMLQLSREIIPQLQCRLVCYRWPYDCEWVCGPGPHGLPQ